MKAITIIIAVSIALVALPTRLAIAAPKAETTLRITSASALNLVTNTWATTLSTGDTVQVELRVLNGAGALSDFVDQGWLPILGYYSYATFTQNGKTYYAHR